MNQQPKLKLMSVTTKFSVIALCASIALAGCANTPMQQTGTNVAVGAALGAGIGNLIGKNTKSTAIGGVIGGVLAYQFGDYIRQSLFGLQQNGVTVDNAPVSPAMGANGQQAAQPVRITLPEYVTFDSGSSTLRRDANTTATLDKISQTLANPQYNYARIEVIGHADSSGDATKNQQFSINRANEVSMYMAQRGVDRNKLRAEGRGASQPIADNATTDGRARNRRVEIIVYPA